MVAPGGCVVAPGEGDMCGCARGHVWLLQVGGGACVVAPGGACVVAPRGERYPSYWNAFLLNDVLQLLYSL